jgi:hypothetical protein
MTFLVELSFGRVDFGRPVVVEFVFGKVVAHSAHGGDGVCREAGLSADSSSRNTFS